jgi:drug/metabolite transporter (DMT)-like permease
VRRAGPSGAESDVQASSAASSQNASDGRGGGRSAADAATPSQTAAARSEYVDSKNPPERNAATRASAPSRVGAMRPPRAVDVMLLVTVVLWALNLTVSRYILVHGFAPIAYSTVRYGLAALVFVALVAAAERSLRVAPRDVPLVALAAALLFLNQLAFVYALERTTASTVGLVLGALPIFTGLIGLAFGVERLPPRFWVGAAVSFAGVALVALGSGGELSGHLGGVLLALATAATWAGYSVAIAPLMQRYSPYRISALVLGVTWFGLLLAGLPQTVAQDYGLGWEVWSLLAFAIVGPLVLTNVLWYEALDRVGPGRATLAANLQPFVAAVFGVLLLSERLGVLQAVGGVLIAAGIVLAMRRAAVRSRV